MLSKSFFCHEEKVGHHLAKGDLFVWCKNMNRWSLGNKNKHTLQCRGTPRIAMPGRNVTVTVLYLHNMWLLSCILIAHAIWNMIQYISAGGQVYSGALVWGHQFLCSWSSTLDFHTALWKGLYLMFMSSQWLSQGKWIFWQEGKNNNFYRCENNWRTQMDAQSVPSGLGALGLTVTLANVMITYNWLVCSQVTRTSTGEWWLSGHASSS